PSLGLLPSTSSPACQSPLTAGGAPLLLRQRQAAPPPAVPRSVSPGRARRPARGPDLRYPGDPSGGASRWPRFAGDGKSLLTGGRPDATHVSGGPRPCRPACLSHGATESAPLLMGYRQNRTRAHPDLKERKFVDQFQEHTRFSTICLST
ncbi:unnamed protein product, partial [Urochloa humidicola]